MNSNLYARLRESFLAHAETPCFLLSDGSAITYAELDLGVGRIASLLVAQGVKPGDRIAVQAPKTPEMIMLYLATLQVGAIFLPLNTAYTPSEIEYFVKDAEPALFVTDAETFAQDAAGLDPLAEVHQMEPQGLAAIIYTSGTTGRSKGAMLSHGALLSNGLALQEAWGIVEEDVLIHALPIFHVHGLFIALHCILLSGASMLWFARFDDAECLAAMPRATLMMGVPTFYTRLLANPGFTREAAQHMRVFVSGSAPLLPSTFEEFEERTGQRILERYGMSEAVVISSNPLDGARVAGSVGYPLPGVSLRVGGGEETGVIEIKGPSCFSGYWRMPEKTAEEFTADGYFITGDVGRVDPDGRVWISGRAKDLIISGGFNVYPREIELIIDEMEGISESAVIGLPHPDFGECVCAVVSGEGEEAALIAELRNQLAAFKTPKKIFFVSELPKNTMGKVQKNLLRETYKATFG